MLYDIYILFHINKIVTLYIYNILCCNILYIYIHVFANILCFHVPFFHVQHLSNSYIELNWIGILYIRHSNIKSKWWTSIVQCIIYKSVLCSSSLNEWSCNCDAITCCYTTSVFLFELKKGQHSPWSKSPVLGQTAAKYQKLAPCLQRENSEESQPDRWMWLCRAKGPGREGSQALKLYACLQESPQLPQSPSIP